MFLWDFQQVYCRFATEETHGVYDSLGWPSSRWSCHSLGSWPFVIAVDSSYCHERMDNWGCYWNFMADLHVSAGILFILALGLGTWPDQTIHSGFMFMWACAIWGAVHQLWPMHQYFCCPTTECLQSLFVLSMATSNRTLWTCNKKPGLYYLLSNEQSLKSYNDSILIVLPHLLFKKSLRWNIW